MKAQKRLSPLACLVIATLIALPLQPVQVHADDGVKQVCGKDGRPPDASAEFDSMTLAERKEYCQAAQASADARKRQLAVGWAFAVTAGICTAGCVGQWAGGFALVQACRFSAIASGVGAILASKSLSEQWKSLASVGTGTTAGVVVTAGSGFLHGAPVIPSSPAGLKTANKKDSCTGAAIATIMSAIEFKGADGSRKTRDENLEAVRSLQSSVKHAVSGADIQNLSGAPGGSGGGGTVNNNPQAPPPDDSPNLSKSNDPCDGVNREYDSNVQCALSVSGTGLSPEIANPEFKKALEKLSGVSADKLAKLQDTGNLMRATLGQALGADGRQKLEDVLATTRQAVLATDTPSSAYASAGGGAKASGDGMPDMNSLIDKLMPKEGEEGPGAGANRPKSLQLGQASRVIASVAGDEENPGVSLFDRVQRRYRVVSTPERIVPLQYQSRENVMLLRQ